MVLCISLIITYMGLARRRVGLKGTGTFYNFKNIYKNCHIMPNLQTTNQYWKCICVCEGSGTAKPPRLPLVYKNVMKKHFKYYGFFSSAVPPGSGAFQMPTRPSSAASASTLRGGRANLRNASVTFSLFFHEASLG